MFTQERKVWAAVPVTPPRNGKGKAVAFADDHVPLPVGLLSENAQRNLGDRENIDDWRRFKEVGLLDEVAMEGRDRQALLLKIAKLEKELFDYQYNMGLLLIEKNEWTSKYDELREELAELHESLKREQSAHLISIAEVEKREENLRNALASKKQCMVDLEKALRQTQAEHGQIKLASETELADARALVVGYHDKSLEEQGKLHTADAKLAEANRMNSELERKLRELEIRESVLRREHASLTAEQEVHEARFSKHKEDLGEWERKLQEKEEKLYEGRRKLIEREEKVNNLDVAHKQKEKRLEEEQKRIDSSNIALKKRDDAISKKVADMTRKEQNIESYRAELEMKEKELNFLAEKLNSRERGEIQKLLDEHRAAFDAEQQELKLNLNRRHLFDKEVRAKFDGLKERELELNHLEGKLRKREQFLENELEKFKEREKDIEWKLKEVKEKEKFLKAEEKRLEVVKKETLSDKQSELNLKGELYQMKAEISQKEINISEATEKLKVSEAERAEHLQLQMELKREIQRYKHQQDLILKKGEDLKEDRMKFEKQWEALDEKRAVVTKELLHLQEEKTMLDDLRDTEDEQLRKNKLATEDYVRREREALKLEKESFAATMKYEQLLLSEKAENEHNILLRDFEARRRDLETDLQNKQEEMHKKIELKEKSLLDQREKATEISSLKEVTQKEMDEVRAERIRLENEKQEMSLKKKQLENHQFELRKDIDALGVLNKKLKEQRRQFVKEKNHFLAYVEKIKDCENCGKIAREYATCNFPLGEIGDNEESPLSLRGDKLGEKVASFGENFERSPAEVEQKDSDSRISWFHKCTTKIFSLSPNRKNLVMDSSLKPCEPCKIFGTDIREQDIAEGPSVKHLPPDNSVRGVRHTTVDYQSDMDSRIQEVPEESEQSELTSGQCKPRKRSGKGICRTRTVKAVIEEAAAFLGNNAELLPNDEHPEDISESRGDSAIAGKAAATTVPRKRTRGQTSQTTATGIDANDSEGHSESVATGGRRKRHQPSTSAVQNHGERRYNLRRHKTIETKTGDQSAGGEKSIDVEMSYEDRPLQAAGKDESASFQAVEIGNENGSQTSLVHVTSYRSTKNQNVAVDRVVRFKALQDDIDVNGDAAKFVEKRDLKEEVDYTPEHCGEDEHNEHILEDDEYDENNNDEDDGSNESEHPGEASISRKVWQFFTS
ncbi:nuclear matrix constituent protein 1-like [Nicotiana tabacum]|uniref:Nuclear matrix constituent protein 1-like n=1 Tax=Nicotiana tabacum TaxID=4097 RepID=A0AC58TPJ9_TOBAC